jgi:hypothetical protein
MSTPAGTAATQRTNAPSLRRALIVGCRVFMPHGRGNNRASAQSRPSRGVALQRLQFANADALSKIPMAAHQFVIAPLMA